MPLNPNELARRDAGAVECRAQPLRVQWTFADLTSRDSHALDARFTCSVRVADASADRRIFAEVFLGSASSVTTDTIASHFQSALLNALRTAAAKELALELVDDTRRAPLIESLRTAGNAVAFACGLELLAPFQLNVESPTLQRQKLEEVARSQAAQRAAGQMQQLSHAKELLEQFQQMREAAPELSASTLLQRINAADRGATLQTLLLATSSQSARATLWAVAGMSLVRIDTRSTPPKTQLIPLPDTLGPLRSVQPITLDGQRRLLIGARGGVMIVVPEEPSNAQLYALPGLESQLGFNRVVLGGDTIWASHSDAGIVSWKLDAGASPAAQHAERTVATAGPAEEGVSIVVSGSASRLTGSGGTRSVGPKNLHALDEQHLIYSLGNELIVRNGEQRMLLGSSSRSDIVAILPTPKTMVAVHADGTLVLIDRVERKVSEVRQRGSATSAAGVMPWLGDVRLLLANDTGPVDCLGLDDPLVTEYLSPYRGLKILTAAADQIAAVTPDRQRVIIWNTWDPQRPAGEIHVTSVARHRVADLEFEG